MLITIIGVVVIFFVARFLASLANSRPAIYNAIGAGAVLIFLLGTWMWATISARPAPVAAVPVAPPVLAVGIAHAPISRTPSATGSPVLASIDGMTMALNDPSGPAGNVFPQGSTIFVNGWAASSAKTRLKRLILVIDHRIAYDGTANYGGSRPDVAAAYKAPAMSSTGYRAVALPTDGLAKGMHVLQIGGVSDGSQHYHVAPTGVTFTVQ
jgi:hypothetical protein